MRDGVASRCLERTRDQSAGRRSWGEPNQKHERCQREGPMKPNLISGIARWSADSVGRLQDDAGTERQLLRRRVDSDRPFQNFAIPG